MVCDKSATDRAGLEIVLDWFESAPAYFCLPDTCSRASMVIAPVRDRKATRFG
jgi:hypothetical protein